jgi:thiamine biosynthesis lipoprotein
MATSFEIVIPCGVPEPVPAAERALDLIADLEGQLTVYRETSEVARLNRLAPTQPVALEARLYALLKTAWRISEETEGAFDATAGALVKTWGFLRRAARVPTMEERRDALGRVGFRKVLFNDVERTCRYVCDGLEINLGSIGKGYALDRAAELLRDEHRVPAALLHGGHSSVYALGTDPRDPRGWSVAIRHPFDADRTLAVIRLRDAGLATSAATFQHLDYHGRKLGHVLDPRTGWPADKLAQATVIAPTSAEADALSTAFFVMGIDGARRYCDTHPQVAAILLPADDLAPVLLNLSDAACGLAPPQITNTAPLTTHHSLLTVHS